VLDESPPAAAGRPVQPLARLKVPEPPGPLCSGSMDRVRTLRIQPQPTLPGMLLAEGPVSPGSVNRLPFGGQDPQAPPPCDSHLLFSLPP
jgi:hypothetical protein